MVEWKNKIYEWISQSINCISNKKVLIAILYISKNFKNINKDLKNLPLTA